MRSWFCLFWGSAHLSCVHGTHLLLILVWLRVFSAEENYWPELKSGLCRVPLVLSSYLSSRACHSLTHFFGLIIPVTRDKVSVITRHCEEQIGDILRNKLFSSPPQSDMRRLAIQKSEIIHFIKCQRLLLLLWLFPAPRCTVRGELLLSRNSGSLCPFSLGITYLFCSPERWKKVNTTVLIGKNVQGVCG